VTEKRKMGRIMPIQRATIQLTITGNYY